MSKFGSPFCYLAVIILVLSTISCLTKNEQSVLKEALAPTRAECKKECTKMETSNKEPMVNEYEDPCMKICVLKATKIINDKGDYDREEFKKVFAKVTGNEQNAVKYQNILDECYESHDEDLSNDEDSVIKLVEIFFSCLDSN